MIAAGSTGSIPATAELIATIARLPHGAVVLPGLDTDLDEESWRLIGGDERNGIRPRPGHPQFAMQALLARIGIARDAVEKLAEPRGRERLVSEALRPAAATDLWRQRAADPAFEAQADAALRHHGHDRSGERRGRGARHRGGVARSGASEDKTAALVTPDRALGAPRRSPRSSAGISPRRIPAAKRSPTRRPASLRGLPPRRRSADLRR